MSADYRIDQIHKRLSQLRGALLDHSIYGEIDSIDKLHLFMQHHVFAIWDFMSLLKTLQQKLCGSCVPWIPPTDITTARLVNEIVLGEESDEDGEGGFSSHFDLYHRAMSRCGASTHTIDRFLNGLREGQSVEKALSRCNAPRSVRHFVSQTFDSIEGGNLCAVAAAFTFGREDLLPDVFQRIVDELNVESKGGLDDFNFYLSRHIELDGDHHGPMAAQMIAALCGENDLNWQVAENAAVRSLQARKVLWDGMYEAMEDQRKSGVVLS